MMDHIDDLFDTFVYVLANEDKLNEFVETHEVKSLNWHYEGGDVDRIVYTARCRLCNQSYELFCDINFLTEHNNVCGNFGCTL